VTLGLFRLISIDLLQEKLCYIHGILWVGVPPDWVDRRDRRSYPDLNHNTLTLYSVACIKR